MTIDEAISEFKERTEDSKKISELGLKSYIPKGKEEERLAEWLEELKFLRQWKSDVMDEFCKYDCNSVEEARHNAYNKAVDDFCAEICKAIVQSERNGDYRFYAVEIKQSISDLAEKLKAGDVD